MAAKAASTLAGSATLHDSASAGCPLSRSHSAATSAASFMARSRTATLAPSAAKRRQQPLPMPLAPPVTAAILSSKRLMTYM